MPHLEVAVLRWDNSMRSFTSPGCFSQHFISHFQCCIVVINTVDSLALFGAHTLVCVCVYVCARIRVCVCWSTDRVASVHMYMCSVASLATALKTCVCSDRVPSLGTGQVHRCHHGLRQELCQLQLDQAGHVHRPSNGIHV